MPRIVLINKSSETGGAAKAALRLFLALKAYQGRLDTKFIAQDGKSIAEGIDILAKRRLSKLRDLFRLAIEKFFFIFQESSKEVRFQFSTGITGRNITKQPLFRKADLIHLHWLYQGFISLNGMKRIFQSGKPVVWTLHDMWPFTGGCHYPGDCLNYLESCGDCPFLRNPSKHDISVSIHRRKLEMFSKYPDIAFVSCSEWLANKARESNILRNHRIIVIPNTLDIDLFSPGNKIEAREKLGIDKDKFIILFGAANINDKRKGFNYLQKALDKIKSVYENEAGSIGLMVFGKSGAMLPSGYTVYNRNLIQTEKDLADIYRAADVFVLPSLQDNLPNTIMESLACGTPVVAFNSGGIPEMIHHLKNGYLADSRNVEDLANGILWVKHNYSDEFSLNCREKVLNDYHPKKISDAYTRLYLSLI